MIRNMLKGNSEMLKSRGEGKSVWVVIVLCLAWMQPARADVVLTSTYDVERVNRTNPSFGPPFVGDRETLAVVNFAWKGWVYLQFDLSQVQDLGDATGMKLRLFEIESGYSSDRRTDIIELYATTDNWTPQTAYSAMPGNLEQLDVLSQDTEQYGWAQWDIEMSDISDDISDGTLSLILEDRQGGQWNMTRYHSAEWGQGQYAPQLVIEGDVSIIPEPTAGLLLAAGSAFLGGRRRKMR